MNFSASSTFQYQENGGWHDFQPVLSISLLAQAHKASTGSFSFRGTVYQVNFIQMTQTNTQTNYTRKLRVVGGSGGGGSGGGRNWEWNEGSRWTPYDARKQAAFTSALQAGQTHVSVKFGNTTYTIDLQHKTQTNTTTGFSRRIRGPSIRAPPAPTPTPAVPKPGFLQRVFGFGGSSRSSSSSSSASSASSSSSPSSASNHNHNTFPRTIQFHQCDAPNWSTITNYQTVQPNIDYNPNETDLMGEQLGTSERVVRLRCSTTQIPCIYRASLVAQCLTASNGLCPSCQFKYTVPGPQPNGTMHLALQPRTSCAGFENVGTIVLRYSFPNGTQGPRMLRPGQRYSGTTRAAYVPNNTQGNETLELLTKAFLRGYLFVVGDSVTTGALNTTVWGGIHQKTNTSGGTARHGYPDPHYFDRVKQECAARGVFTNAHERALAQAKVEAAEKKKEEDSGSGSGSGSGETKKMDEDDGGDDRSKRRKTSNDGGQEGDTFVPQAGDDTIDEQILHLSTELQKAMASRNTAQIRLLMTQRNECSQRKKVIEQHQNQDQ